MAQRKMKFEKITVAETGHRSVFQVITSYQDHQDQISCDIVNVFYTQRVQLCPSCKKKSCAHVNAVRYYTETGHQQPSNPPLHSNQWERCVISCKKMMDQLYFPASAPKGYHIEEVTNPQSKSKIFTIIADVKTNKSKKRKEKNVNSSSKKPKKLRKCKNCKATNVNYKLYICKGCSKTRYCSTKCQKAHWKRKHSKKCIK